MLLLPSSSDRISEGGRRTKDYFKSSLDGDPLVSVITIVLNGVKYLENAIRSVLNQTYGNVEYIIIDGGSNDGTLDVIRKYGDQIDYWVSEGDDGIADAFNKGISLCAGEVIGIINADDWYEPDAIEKIMACSIHPAVYCGNVQYWNEGEKDYVFTTNIHGLSKEMTLNHPAIFVSASIYQKYGVFDSKYKYAMDYELLLRFYIKGVEFVRINSVLSNMRLAGLSDRYRQQSYREVRLAKIQYGESFLRAYSYNVWQLFRKSVSRLLTKMGLEQIVRSYRSKYSVIKKTR